MLLAVPAGSSVLDAALRSGVSLPYSCRTGLCGTCKGTLVEGRMRGPLADGRNAQVGAETDAAVGDVLLLCRAFPLSDCVLHVMDAKELEFEPQVFPARIAKVDISSAGVAIINMRLPMNRKLNYRAGQSLDILLEDGARVSYSIASAPVVGGTVDLELHVRHHLGGRFSDRLFKGAPTPTMVQLESPFGNFYLRDATDGPVILLATGTGFAPIQSIVEDAIRSGRTKRQAFHLYWGARQATDLYRLQRALDWERGGHIRFVPVLSRAEGEKGRWRHGHVQQAVAEDFADLGEAHVYACGSDAMVTSARQDLTDKRGLNTENFFADSFFACQ